MLAQGPDTRLERLALGPALGQCCGGAAVLLWEVLDAERLDALRAECEAQGFRARPVLPGAAPLRASARRRIEARQSAGTLPPASLVGGWLIEPLRRDRVPVWIHGAGHVGRALARILAPMPQFRVVLVDARADRLDALPEGIRGIHDLSPGEAMATAPDEATHFVMTHDHGLDLALCHKLLGRRFSHAGLIGSATKWARFRRRLLQLGHAQARIDRIACPIGAPELGKHPQAIAVGVAAALLRKHDQIAGRPRSSTPQEQQA